jgi:hypothetical protein
VASTVRTSSSQPESPYRRLRSCEDSVSRTTPTDFEKKEKFAGSDVIEFLLSGKNKSEKKIEESDGFFSAN